MAEDIKQEMNSTPGCIPSKWNRNTVADGDWLQKYTLAPLSSRDNFLADKISGTEFNLDEEIRERKAGDAYLSGAITSVSSDFYTFSGNVCASAENLSAALSTEIERATANEDRIEENYQIADKDLQTQIDDLKAATDVICVYGTYEEFTAGSANLTKTDNDFIKVLRDDHYQPNTSDPDYQTNDDDYYQVYYEYHISAHDGWEGWSAIGSLDPYYSVSEIDDKLDEVSSYIDDSIEDLSATVSSNYLSANTTAVQPGHNIKITNPVAGKPYIKIETSSHVTFDGVSSTNLSATNASGTSAKFTNFSGTNINGASKTATIDNLIGSAQSGKFAYNVVNSAKFSAINSTTSTAFLSGGFGISAGNNLSLSFADNIIKLNANDTGITAISAGSTKYTGPVFSASAGTGINFANDNNGVLGIKASNSLITSATGGSAAYNILTSQSATITNGPGILFYNDDNKLGIKVDVRGVSNTITGIGTSALSAGDNYRQGKNIEITGTDIKDISLSSRIDVPDGVIVYTGPENAKYVDIVPQYIHINSYGRPGTDTYLCSDVFSAIVPNPEVHLGSLTGTISWYNLTQIPYNYMKVNKEASGSILSANRKITLVVTSTLPSVIQDPDTYYIV